METETEPRIYKFRGGIVALFASSWPFSELQISQNKILVLDTATGSEFVVLKNNTYKIKINRFFSLVKISKKNPNDSWETIRFSLFGIFGCKKLLLAFKDYNWVIDSSSFWI
jgi:hypothetical protein